MAGYNAAWQTTLGNKPVPVHCMMLSTAAKGPAATYVTRKETRTSFNASTRFQPAGKYSAVRTFGKSGIPGAVGSGVDGSRRRRLVDNTNRSA